MAKMRARFWDLPLERLNGAEWEALCDGCAKCCLLKLEAPDTGEIAYTSVSCRLLDPQSCRCGNYALRRQLVPGCVIPSPANIGEISGWMPATCAYRLRAEGRPLPDWHPLLAGPGGVHDARQSVRGRCTP